jgi:hypothetical protein
LLSNLTIRLSINKYEYIIFEVSFTIRGVNLDLEDKREC